MAVGVLVELPGFGQAQYDLVASKLAPGGVLSCLADWPVDGILSHVAGPTPQGWRVVDVWESEEAFKTFAEILNAIHEEQGWNVPEPQIFPVYNFVEA